jgi:TIR domain
MHDIFISYASADRDVAFRIVAFLEQNGIRCWVAPRDVPPGMEYGQAIIDGIAECRALVLILSDQSNESQYVRKEVERAVSRTKPVLPVRIREVAPSGSLEFYISSAQWVDAWKSPMEQHLLPLVSAIKAMGTPAAASVRSSALPPPRRSKTTVLAGIVVGLALFAAVAFWYTTSPGATRVDSTQPAAAVSVAPGASSTSTPDASAATKPSAPVTTPSAPSGPKRGDVAFVLGSWCEPYQGMKIRYDVIRTGPDTVLMQVDHPQSSPFEVRARVVPIKEGFEFRPADAEANEKNISRFSILDDSTLKLTLADGEAKDGPVRVRCPAVGSK